MPTRHHLAILKRSYIDEILTGAKTTECRLSKTRRAPFGVIQAGDIIWLKISGGPIVAQAEARSVRFYDTLNPAKLALARRQYGSTIRAKPGYFAAHRSAKYATIIRLCRVTAIEPLPFPKRDRRAWLVLPQAIKGPVKHVGRATQNRTSLNATLSQLL